MSLYMHMLNIKEVGIKRLSLYLCLPWICFRCWIRWKDVLFTLWGRFQRRRMHSCWGKRGNWCTCVCSINYLFGFFCCPCLWFISFILIDTQYHVHVSNKWENLTGYLQTLPGPPVPDGDYGVYALDTEMVCSACITSRCTCMLEKNPLHIHTGIFLRISIRVISLPNCVLFRYNCIHLNISLSDTNDLQKGLCAVLCIFHTPIILEFYKELWR